MKTVGVQSRTLLATGQVLSLAGSLLLAGPAFANPADGNRESFRQLRLDNPGMDNQELRQLFRANTNRNQRVELRQQIREQTGGGKAFRAEYQAIKNNQHVAHPSLNLPFTPKNDFRSTYVSERGKTRNVTRGLELDLTSSQRSIVLGENLFADATSYVVNIGGEERVLTSGSRVTSAEFVALQQVIDGGSQSLVVDQSGKGVDGSFTLNSIDDAGRNIKASSLTVSAGVDAIGNFGRRSDFKVTRELVNYGNIYALSDDASGNKASIGARNITNHTDATISTIVPAAVADEHGAIDGPVDLSLTAERNLSNAGTISGSGSVALTAGQSVTNSGSVSAQSNFNLQSQAVYNSGSLSSNSGDVNFNTPVAAEILVDNTGGTISATQGVINFRDPGFTPKVDTTLVGGDWFSNELNLHSGDGHLNVNVREISGAVNAYAGTARINADSPNLLINDLVTSGDPLISNTATIILGNQSTSGGPLTVISGMDIQIQSGVTLSTDNAPGDAGDILLIAGAAFTPGAGNITVTGASATGGNVTFVGTAPNITANGGNGDGGDITIAAFLVGATGQINLGGSVITATGSSGNDNGNVLMLANSIATGFIDTNGTGTTATGNITLNARQPQISGSLVINDPNGNVISGSLIPGAVVGGSSISVNAALSAGGSISMSEQGIVNINHPLTARGSVTALTTNSFDIRNNVTAPGGILFVAGQDISVITFAASFVTTAPGQAGNVTMVSGANFTDNGTTVTITGASNTTNSTDISLTFGSEIIDARGTGSNANGGNVTLVAFANSTNATGRVSLDNEMDVLTGGTNSGNNGNITVVAGNNDGGQGIYYGNPLNTTGGGVGNGGNITLHTSTPLSGAVLSKADGGVQSGSFVGGTVTNSAIMGANVSALITNGGDVSLLAGRGGGQSIDIETVTILNDGALRINAVGTLSDLRLRNMQAGSITVTTTGDIGLFGSGWTTNLGGGIVIVTGESIGNNTPGHFFDTRATGGGSTAGSITVITGATFSENATSITITGPSAAGGSLDLGNGFGDLNASGLSGANGGDVNLVAFANTSGGFGAVFADATTNVFTGGSGAGTNGNILAMGGSTGTAVRPGNQFSTMGGQTGTGSIDLLTKQAASGAVISKTTGKVTAGSFTTGAVTTTGSLSGTTNITDFSTDGAPLRVVVGNQLDFTGVGGTVGSADFQVGGPTQGIGTFQATGSISLTSVGNIALRGNLIAPGGLVIVTGGGIGNVNSGDFFATATTGDAGDVVVVAGATFTQTATNITITGASGSGSSGIDLGNGFTTIDTRSLGGNGDGGDITLITFDGAGNGLISSGGSITTGGVGTGTNGNITVISGRFVGTSIQLEGAMNTSGGQTGTGNLLFQNSTPVTGVQIAKANAGLTGTFLGGAATNGGIFQSGGSITVDNANVTINAGSNADMQSINSGLLGNIQMNAGLGPAAAGVVRPRTITAGTLSVTAPTEIDLRGGNFITTVGALFVTGGNISNNGGNMIIDASSATGDAGKIIMVAGAAYTQNSGTVLVTGGSTTGGSVSLGNGYGGFDASSNGGNGDGGQITLVAYPDPIGTTGGNVFVDSTVISDVGGNGTGANGTFLVLAGRDSGATSIQYGGSITASGGASGTGLISLKTVEPGTNVTVSRTTITETAGTFDSNVVANGFIQTSSALTSKGGNINILSGNGGLIGSVLDVSGTATGNGGSITIQMGGAELNLSGGGTNRINSINTNGGTTSGDGGNVSIVYTGGNNLRVHGNFLQQTNTQGDGGDILLDAGTSNIIFDSNPVTIGANAAGGAPADGGSISLSANSFVLTGVNVSLQANGVAGGDGGAISLTTAVAISNIIGPGANQFSISQTGPNSSLSLASTGAGVTVNAPITVGSLSLTSTNANIVQSAGSVFNVSALNINLLGGTPGTADLDNFVNSVGAISGSGGGSIFLDNGATDLQIGALGAAQSLTASTTGTMSTISNITTTGDIDLITTALTNNFAMAANTISVTSPGTSNLTVTGSGSFEATGAGEQVTFDSNADITIGGTFSFISDAEMTLNTAGQTFTVASLANIVGLQTVIVNVVGSTYQPIGSLTGNPLIINGGGPGNPGTIANSTGDVILNGDVIIIGSNIAIIAAGNITGTGILTIDSSAPAGTAGSVTLFAGYDFTPPTPGQVTDDTTTFTNFTANATGGSINLAGVNIDASSAGANGGDVLIVANGGTTNSGSITLGNIDASATINGGDIVVIGEGNITLGNLNNSAGTSTGSIGIAIATPVVTGTPQVLNGTLSGGGFDAGALVGTGNVSVGTVDAGTGIFGITISGQTSSITVANSVTAGTALLSSNGGDINLSNLSAINVLPDTDGDGGILLLNSATLTLNKSATTPIQLTANGSGAGDGGTILITTTDPAAVYIGNVPKAKSGSMSLSAKGGTTGNGGSIDVTVGGNLTVEASGVQAGPGTGGDGANIKLAAGNGSSKGGSLSIIGSLYATGNGGGAAGKIELFSKSSTAFNIGAAKTAKNGIMGQLSAGEIIVNNHSGGVMVSNSSAMAANSIELRAGGKGTITTADGAIITALNDLELFASTGDIGKKSPVYVNTPLLTVETQGAVNIEGKGGGLLTLNDSKGKSFKLKTTGGTTLNNITAEDGNLCITANSGTLTVGAGKHLEAKNGLLCLLNCNTFSGEILLGANSIIETSGQGDRVTISIGVVQKNPVGQTPPANIIIDEQGGGSVIFASPASGFVTGAAASHVNAIGKDVILANLSTQSATRKITFGDNVTVTADPPIGVRNVQTNSIVFPSQAGQVVETNRSSTDLSSFALTGSGALSNALTDSVLNTRSVTAIPTDLLSTFTPATAKEATPVFNASISAIQTADETAQQNFITDAYVWSDHDLGLGSATTLKRNKIASSESAPSQTTVAGSIDNDESVEVAKLRKGTLLLAPSKDTRLDTPMGTVEVAKDSVALVVLDDTRLGVYDLHDARKGSVRVSSGSKTTTLSPGRCTVLTNRIQHSFEHVNPMESIGYKSVSDRSHGDGIIAFNAEFSTTHVMGSVKPLMEILNSKHAGARRMSSRLIKTSAVLMHLGGGEQFKIYAQPSITAMSSF